MSHHLCFRTDTPRSDVTHSYFPLMNNVATSFANATLGFRVTKTIWVTLVSMSCTKILVSIIYINTFSAPRKIG